MVHQRKTTYSAAKVYQVDPTNKVIWCPQLDLPPKIIEDTFKINPTSPVKQCLTTTSKTSHWSTPDRRETIKRKVYHLTAGPLATRTNCSPNSAWAARISLLSKQWKSCRYKRNKECCQSSHRLKLRVHEQTNDHQNQYLESTKTQ